MSGRFYGHKIRQKLLWLTATSVGSNKPTWHRATPTPSSGFWYPNRIISLR